MRLLWPQARKWSGLYSYSRGARTGHGWCELFTVWSLQHFCKEYSAIVCGHAVITCHSLLIDTWFTVHKPTLPLTFHKIIIINAHIPLVRFVAQHVLQQIYNKFGKWSLTLNRWQQYIFHVTVLLEKENHKVTETRQKKCLSKTWYDSVEENTKRFGLSQEDTKFGTNGQEKSTGNCVSSVNQRWSLKCHICSCMAADSYRLWKYTFDLCKIILNWNKKVKNK